MGQARCRNNLNTPLYGILINSINGTQLFDAVTKSYSDTLVNLGLQTENSARYGSRAAIMGDSAYFAGTDGSQMCGLHFGRVIFHAGVLEFFSKHASVLSQSNPNTFRENLNLSCLNLPSFVFNDPGVIESPAQSEDQLKETINIRTEYF
jgi:hypothetical protein